MNEIRRNIFKVNRVIRSKYFQLKTKWENRFIILKYKFELAFEVLFIITLLFIPLQIFGLINIGSIQIILDKISNISPSIIENMVFAHISLSFLILSLLSFVTNLKKNKIYGTSLYQIIFSYSIFGNLSILSTVIFSLLFLTLYLYLIKPIPELITFSFVFSVFLLAYYLIKTIKFTNNQSKANSKITALYYKQNLKEIKNNWLQYNQYYQRPILFQNLLDDTREKITKSEIEYKLNFMMLRKLCDLSLINHRRLIQENHTEKYRKRDDIINIYIYLIQYLIDSNKNIDALEEYIELISIFMKNEVFIDDFELFKVLEKVMNNLRTNNDIAAIKRNERLIFNSMRITIKYTYYRINNDFSYTRLGKTDLDYIFTPLYPNDYYVNYYNLIIRTAQEDDDRTVMVFRFLENIRYLAIDLDRPFNQIDYNKVNFNYLEILRESYDNLDGDLELIGTPLAELLLEFIQKKDIAGIYYIVYLYNSNSGMYACIIACASILKKSFSDDFSDKYFNEVLKLLLMKIERWDLYKLRFNIDKIARSFKDDRIYSTYIVMKEEVKILEVIYEAIKITRNNEEFTKIKIENENILKVCNIINDNTNREKINQKYNDIGQDIIGKLKNMDLFYY